MRKNLKIRIDDITLEGILSIPEKASGIVIFAHGSGSGRLSPRNNLVADVLNRGGIGTFLPDLLTEEEDSVYENRFDIDLLSLRLAGIFNWIESQSEAKNFPVGIFGASTGAAAALKVAAQFGKRVAAIVSRGGRPDLAMEHLKKVVSPTLFIVGGNDFDVIELNEKAFAALSCEKRLEIVPGATHLFEESGTLEDVADLAVEWFSRYFIFCTNEAKKKRDISHQK